MTAPTASPTGAVGERLHYVRDDRLVVVTRQVPTPSAPAALLEALLAGPSEQERELGVGVAGQGVVDVDEILAATRRTQQRIRLLPARGVVYLLLAGCWFADLGYRQVGSKLVAGLPALPVTAPSGSARRQARQRLGPAPSSPSPSAAILR
ncbi:transposase domain-containing protein [Plantactinospora sp. DSM 117369]